MDPTQNQLWEQEREESLLGHLQDDDEEVGDADDEVEEEEVEDE
jgi:hypothetical protein